MRYLVCVDREEVIDTGIRGEKGSCLLAVAVKSYEPLEGPWAKSAVTLSESVPAGYICINAWLMARLRELDWLDNNTAAWWGGDESLASRTRTNSGFVAKCLEDLVGYLELPSSEDVAALLAGVCARYGVASVGEISSVTNRGSEWSFQVAGRQVSLSFPVSMQGVGYELSR